MIPTLFFGGTDVQRSLNHYDSKCINLYATTNDDGSIKAFVNTPGLTLYASIPAAAIASGIYTASNGRCFMVASSTLYEITTGGTLTSRGAITAGTISRMSDNGNEMIIVNGTDGWIFTFIGNVLKKITVATGAFTVSIATPAVFTSANHGLVVGDQIALSTTISTILSDNLLTALNPTTIDTYYNPIESVISPDGLNVYVLNNTTSWSSIAPPYKIVGGYMGDVNRDRLSQYVRNPTSGVINQLSPDSVNLFTGAMVNYCLSLGFVGVVSVNYNSIEISPDGLFVYILTTLVGGNTPPIYFCQSYSRNITTGALTSSATVQVFATEGNDIVFSPDGLFAYISNKTANTISQYSRSTSTGVLTALSPATITGATSVTEMVITPDGNSVYAISTTDFIFQYTRVIGTGLMTSIGTIATGAGAKDIVCSADGKAVYVSNFTGDSISQYSRAQTSTWALTALTPSTVSIGTKYGPYGLAITADGLSVYATNYNVNSISQLNRDPVSFLLSTPSIALAQTNVNPISITISPDDKNIYVTNFTDRLVSMFSRALSTPAIGLPTGLTTTDIYYVITAGLSANTFEVSLTSGGTAANTSGTQAGIHTYTSIGYGFPNGCTTVSYVDGRFVACQAGTQNFYVSNVLNGGYWNPLNVQTADSNPDYVVGQVVIHNELIIFCEQTGETYYDSGTFPSPFVRNLSGVFEAGCISPYSIAKIDNSVMWLGKSTTGQGIIYRLQGYTPVRISSYSIEYAMQQMTTVADARAFTYQQDGHHFYVISFPSGNKTFVFDINTQLWHERANFSAGVFSRWEAQEYAYFDGKHLVCDYTEGKIYSIDLSAYTYGIEARKWVRSFRVPTNSMKRTIHHKMALEAEMGVGVISGPTPTVMLKYSNDGGHTWSADNWRDLGIGSIGEYAKRVFWNRLGMTTGQPRLYELSGTSATKITLLNVFLE